MPSEKITTRCPGSIRAWLRPVLRDHPRRGLALGSEYADARQHAARARQRSGIHAGGMVLHRRHRRPDGALHQRSRRRKTRRAVFLDRDGVINVKQPDGHYVLDWDQFVWIPETIDWIRLFNSLDFLVIVVTNQRAVAKGLITIESLDSIHTRMVEQLALKGAVIDDVLVCPHEIDACDCRKPMPGMVHAARDKWRIDLAQSMMVGDSPSDLQLAVNCGMKYVGVAGGKINQVVQQHDRDGSGASHVAR